ncbi:hypothetical protein W04_1880 [Pseudoalteromonas sp. SW0106-04]|uniref:DUF3192 domain-containing protein n=1 Tax=Pseudoalteromonas sp. SW0106-04 TaxID=1702169 RepID=UPI0006B69FA2|nr:DUF3192 domain-containing protein [Pseudoalteromonas sp. SW0106-04]GAP75358.1 hypothetical protein W04_1880 [Pseudoalteromonas sp. SW0106-04]
MKKTLIAALVALPLLGGCVVSVNDGDADARWAGSDWQQQQKDNRTYIADLQLGTGFALVKNSLGTPDFSESFRHQQDNYQVLFYATQSKKSDGKISKDECTPLVFADGALVSVGDSAYQALINKL